MLAPTSKSPEEREFVVASGAAMCMLSKKGFDLRRTGGSAEIQDPMLLCGRIFLVARFRLVFFPKKKGARGLRSCGSHILKKDPFFPEFLCGARCPWRI